MCHSVELILQSCAVGVGPSMSFVTEQTLAYRLHLPYHFYFHLNPPADSCCACSFTSHHPLLIGWRSTSWFKQLPRLFPGSEVASGYWSTKDPFCLWLKSWLSETHPPITELPPAALTDLHSWPWPEAFHLHFEEHEFRTVRPQTGLPVNFVA